MFAEQNGEENSNNVQSAINIPHHSFNNLSSDLSKWMTYLPTSLKKLPVINLAIPGTHDSGTYSITSHSEFAPDLDKVIMKWKFLGPALKHILCNWTKTQEFDVRYQLKAGIRYFDLRISRKKNIDNFFLVHGLYGAELDTALDHMAEFLSRHTEEIVILDCQHFFDMSEKDHDVLADLFYLKFGKKIVPCVNNYMKHVTLEYMIVNHYQVLIVYRHPDCRVHKFFPSSSYPTPWPNTTDADKLVMLLSENLKRRNPNVGYVSQFILTPNKKTISGGICSNLRKRFALPLAKHKLHWIKEQRPGWGGINVVIADFIDLNNSEFARSVINLNLKLLPDVREEHSQSSTYLPPISD